MDTVSISEAEASMNATVILLDCDGDAIAKVDEGGWKVIMREEFLTLGSEPELGQRIAIERQGDGPVLPYWSLT